MARPDLRWIIFIVVLILMACGEKRPPMIQPTLPTPPPAQVSTPPPAPPLPARPPERRPTPPTEEELFSRLSLDELNGQQPLGDAFFAYDRADLTEAARAALQRDADWMRKWSVTRVRIEGHADERGTSEYNLALGERRAASARDYLVSLGVDTSRIGIASRGKEAPFCTTHDEDCWFENRRAHFLITAK
jgi:peptidoglycan-associated lipoprotein